MKRLIGLTAAATLLGAALTPALAASSRVDNRGVVHAEPYRPIHRGFASDPSFSNRAGINFAKQTGRCVTDLGYGRFEYCDRR